MNVRQASLHEWLINHCQLTSFESKLLPGDASFRRYFRIKTEKNNYIAMDAPPERENNCEAFVAIAKSLRSQGLQTPEVFAEDFKQGFLLLTDFGDDLYLQVLNESNSEALYSKALTALATLQNCKIHDWKIPFFTAELMYQELELSKEWFLQKHLRLDITPEIDNMLAQFFKFLAKSASEQPQVFMHRDYHSANLLLLSNDAVGILDFQDAFTGPVTYDVVSLLRDCYVAWPDALVKKAVLQYKNLSGFNSTPDTEFIRWFDLMGLQRHLKALLTFSRKFHRDNNSNYLQHIPRTLNYLITVARHYPECHDFNLFLQNKIVPAMEMVSLCAP